MSHRTTPSIAGAEEFVSWFGIWPDFHDAEVLEVCLRRDERSSLRIHVWRTTQEVDSSGFFKTHHHAVVTFWFEHVTDLQLADFSGQNVIAGLSCDRFGNGLRVQIFPSYGIGGWIDADEVTLSFEPVHDKTNPVGF